MNLAFATRKVPSQEMKNRSTALEALPVLLFACGLAAAITGSMNTAQGAQDPDYYNKRATWHESMAASIESIARNLSDDFTGFESKTVRGGDPAKPITVSVRGAQEMYLIVTGIPDNRWGMADWAGARLIDKSGTAKTLRSLKTVKTLLGRHEWDMTLRSGLYQKMRMGGRQFADGLHVQANSIVMVRLDGEYDQFEAVIGLDDWTGTNGHVRFSVVGSRTAARAQLWELLKRDFSEEEPRREMRRELEDRIWDQEPFDGTKLASAYAMNCGRVPPLAQKAQVLASTATSSEKLAQIRTVYHRSRELHEAFSGAKAYDFRALEMAVADLTKTFPGRYPTEFASRLPKLKDALRTALGGFQAERLEDWEELARLYGDLKAFEREALIANPLLDFERLLVIKRKTGRRTQALTVGRSRAGGIHWPTETKFLGKWYHGQYY